MIDRKYGFKLQQTIPFEVQTAIIEGMKYEGQDHPLHHGPNQPACMKLLHLRIFDFNDPRCYQSGTLKNNVLDEHDYDDFVYINRANPNLDWHWVDNPLTELVRPQVEKLSSIYDFMTRVTVLVTNVGSHVPFHREWLYGNTYESVYPGAAIKSAQYFQRKDLIVGDYEHTIDTSMHRNQNFYACKIPLTTIEGNNGNSYFKFDNNEIVKYGAGNRMFCINEIEMKHGVLETGFLRGVIYIDGKINLDKLNENFHSEFEELVSVL